MQHSIADVQRKRRLDPRKPVYQARMDIGRSFRRAGGTRGIYDVNRMERQEGADTFFVGKIILLELLKIEAGQQRCVEHGDRLGVVHNSVDTLLWVVDIQGKVGCACFDGCEHRNHQFHRALQHEADDALRTGPQRSQITC